MASPFPTYAYQSLVGGGITAADPYGTISNQYTQGAWTLQDTEIRAGVSYNSGATLLFGGGQWGQGLPANSYNGGHIYAYYGLTTTAITNTAPIIECQMPTYDSAVESMWYGSVGPNSVSRVFAGVANSNGYAKVYVRQDGIPTWVPTFVDQSTYANATAQVRAGIVYQDQVTGASLTFCGATDDNGFGGIYRGTCSSPASGDPGEYLGVTWTTPPELPVSATNASYIIASYSSSTLYLTVTVSYSGSNLAPGTPIVGDNIPAGCTINAAVSVTNGIGTYTLTGGPASSVLSQTMSAGIEFQGWYLASTQLLHIVASGYPTGSYVAPGMTPISGASFLSSCTIATQRTANNSPPLPGGTGSFTLNNPPGANVWSMGSPGAIWLVSPLPYNLTPRVMSFASSSNGTQQITAGYTHSTNTLNVTSVQIANLAPGTAIAGTGIPAGCTIATGSGGTGSYTLSGGPSGGISSEFMTASGTSLYATLGYQVWMRIDGSSPSWVPAWTKALSSSSESSQSGLRALAPYAVSADLIVFPEGSDWSATKLVPMASTTSTTADLTLVPTVLRSLAQLQTDIRSAVPGSPSAVVTYVIGGYNDYHVVSSYGLIGLHVLVNQYPTGALTYAPTGATGAPAVQQAFYYTLNTGTFTLMQAGIQIPPGTESIRFMIPCGNGNNSLVAAGGFDYKNATEVITSQTITASCTNFTLNVSVVGIACLGVGTVISDAGGHFPVGTIITALGTGSGGMGSYTISNSVNIVGGESMTAVTVGTGSTGVDGFGWIAFDTVANVT